MKNLARLLALCDRDNLKVIAVKDKIANVTNGHVLIRRYLDVPNGFYWPGANDDVVTAPHPDNYPDVDNLKPDFDSHICLGSIDRACMTSMIKACQEAMEIGNNIILNDNQLFYYKTHSKDQLYCEGVLPLPLKGFPNKIVLNPVYLDIVLKEMINYASAKVVVNQSLNKPLIIGDNWNRCGMIMPVGDTNG